MRMSLTERDPRVRFGLATLSRATMPMAGRAWSQLGLLPADHDAHNTDRGHRRRLRRPGVGCLRRQPDRLRLHQRPRAAVQRGALQVPAHGTASPASCSPRPRRTSRILDHPWPGGTTRQLLKDALIDADLAGNAFIYRDAGRSSRLRPDWVTIIAGSPRSDATTWDLDAEVLGYGYQPGGPANGRRRSYLQRAQVAHFKSTTTRAPLLGHVVAGAHHPRDQQRPGGDQPQAQVLRERGHAQHGRQVRPGR